MGEPSAAASKPHSGGFLEALPEHLQGDATSKVPEIDSQSSLYEDAQTQIEGNRGSRGENPPGDNNGTHQRGNRIPSQVPGVRSKPRYGTGICPSTEKPQQSSGERGGQEATSFTETTETAETTETTETTEPPHIQQAIREHNMSSLHQLLKDGEDPNIADERGVRPLYLAAGLGHEEAVKLLLTAGADVESYNPRSPTYSTALHKAVDGNYVQIAEVLLQEGAYIDAVNVSGKTCLMAAVRYRNIDMARLLLRYGADKDMRDRSGSNALDYAAGSEEIMALLQTTQLLQGPPKTTKIQTPDPVFTQPRAPEHNRDKILASRGYRATVVDFFTSGPVEHRMEKSLSVYDLLYGSQVILEAPQQGSYGGSKPDFRWYHLPANNLEWVQDLMQRHIAETASGSHVLSERFKSLAGLSGSRDRHHSTSMTPLSYMRPTCRSFKIGSNGEESAHENIVAFIPYLHFETYTKYGVMVRSIKKGLQVSAGKRKPRQMQKKQGTQPQVSHRSEDRDHDIPEDPEILYNHLVQGYLTTASPGKVPLLQPRRTLDQYFYTHLNTIERDRDQVVYRYASDMKKEPNMFMVDQLWLWIIDGETIITCAPTNLGSQAGDAAATKPPAQETNEAHETEIQGTQTKLNPQNLLRNKNRRTRKWVAELAQALHPQRPHRHEEPDIDADLSDDADDYIVDMKYRPLDVQYNIFRHLRTPTRAPIASAHELASVVTNHCANVFDHHEIPGDYQFFDFFERSIGRVSDQAARRLKSFCRAAAFLSGEEVQQQLSIEVEARLLVEIEDIHDELIILKMVLNDQQAKMKDLSDILDPLGYDLRPDFPGEYLSLKGNRLLETHLQRIDTMESMTVKTAKTIRSLLDLKQKQATIAQALSSVSYAKQEAEQAKESTRQGRTLMLFTVVTIVFLPLSFMAAFFAIEIDVFPLNENGKLELSYVLTYMLSISAGLSVPFIFVVFNQDRVSDWLRYLRPRLSYGYVLFSALLILLAVIMVVLWTSPLEYASKLGATIGTLLFGFVCAIVVGIRRLMNAARQAFEPTATFLTDSDE